ncbi:hypothetical protein MKW98_015189 [Papaver atlanticum]|uniref:Uncharacterized protein n=1 Tax=Papaver atlanticum TaxID=357466 RepID=A0AAD4XTT1_9MAGN|nr:hypothetical protein MKW98_015189 [Papaver atlanticum]
MEFPSLSVLGVAPAVNPLVAALGQVSIPALPGLPGSTISTEPDFDLDIKDDVQDEVSKFGTIKHIFVDKNSAGHVYLRFETTTLAISVHRDGDMPVLEAACTDNSWEVSAVYKFLCQRT